MPLSKKRKFRHLLYPILLASISFLTTLCSCYFLYQNIERNERERFDNYAFEIEQQIKFRMETYINTLKQTESMFDVVQTMNREKFRNYINSLNILHDYPGIQGIGYVQLIEKKDLQKHLKEIRDEGFPQYKIWPDTPRDKYSSIVYIEPFDWRNQKAFGYDMHTDEIRSAAMDQAAKSGEPSASETIQLVQESKNQKQPGFNIYVPLYKPNSPIQTLEERQQNLIGFLYAPFRTYDLFNGIFSYFGNKPQLKVNIYGPDKSLMYTYNERSKLRKDHLFFTHSLSLPVAQKNWIIQIESLPTFADRSSHYIPIVIFVLGSLISFLLFWIILRQTQFSLNENSRAAQFEILNSVGKTLLAELDLQKLVQYLTNAGRVVTDSRWGAYFQKSDNENPEDFAISAVSGAPLNEFLEIMAPIKEDIIKKLFHQKESVYGQIQNEQSIIKNYLAVSVISRSGDIIGGLFYGDQRPENFGERDRNIIEGIAAQASIGIDNARLFKEANDAIHVRDEFLSVASHELKTPITSLKLQFQQAMKMIESGNNKVFEREAVKLRVRKTVQQMDRMNRLIEDMLDASRISLSKIHFEKTEFDLNFLTSEVIDNFAEQLTSQHIPYTFEKSPRPALVCGDSYRIEQVISNLISNAMKYGKGNEINIKIMARGNEICLSVQDHGLGIAKNKIDKIFDRYERAVAGSNISGLGLGLYISQHIVQAHNGKLKVESTLGEGSTFTMTIPKSGTSLSQQ